MGLPRATRQRGPQVSSQAQAARAGRHRTGKGPLAGGGLARRTSADYVPYGAAWRHDQRRRSAAFAARYLLPYGLPHARANGLAPGFFYFAILDAYPKLAHRREGAATAGAPSKSTCAWPGGWVSQLTEGDQHACIGPVFSWRNPRGQRFGSQTRLPRFRVLSSVYSHVCGVLKGEPLAWRSAGLSALRWQQAVASQQADESALDEQAREGLACGGQGWPIS